MKASKQFNQKVLRIMLGALISSDLTAEELMELSQRLVEEPSIPVDLSLLISETLARLRQSGYSPSISKSPEPYQKYSSLEVDDMLQALQYRGVSRVALLNAMNAIAPEITRQIEKRKPSIPEALRKFMAAASDEQKNNLLLVLDPNSHPDAYLKGITSRRKG